MDTAEAGLRIFNATHYRVRRAHSRMSRDAVREYVKTRIPPTAPAIIIDDVTRAYVSMLGKYKSAKKAPVARRKYKSPKVVDWTTHDLIE